MILLQEVSEEPSATFKILLVASEIIIPLIVFIGVYLIFKPVFGKKKDEDKKDSEESPDSKN